MQPIKTTRKTRAIDGNETLSYTVTSRELVWQVPTAARFRSAYLGDRSPNTPFINAKGTAF